MCLLFIGLTTPKNTILAARNLAALWVIAIDWQRSNQHNYTRSHQNSSNHRNWRFQLVGLSILILVLHSSTRNHFSIKNSNLMSFQHLEPLTMLSTSNQLRWWWFSWIVCYAPKKQKMYLCLGIESYLNVYSFRIILYAQTQCVSSEHTHTLHFSTCQTWNLFNTM